MQPQNQIAMVNKKEQEIKRTEKTIENIEESLTRSEEFLIKNQNSLLIGVLVLLAIVLGYFGYQKYIIEPKTQDAQEQIYQRSSFLKPTRWTKRCLVMEIIWDLLILPMNTVPPNPVTLPIIMQGCRILKKVILITPLIIFQDLKLMTDW